MNWLKALLAVVALVWFAHWNYERGRTEVLADWSASQVAAEQAVRQLESTWQARVELARTEADEKVQEIKATAGRVSANADRLHVAALAAAKRAACKNTSPTAGPGDSGLLLADMLNRVGERAGKLAAYADRERIAREECQAAWPK